MTRKHRKRAKISIKTSKFMTSHDFSLEVPLTSSSSNTVATVRNESRKILGYLMHFCSSSRYVM